MGGTRTTFSTATAPSTPRWPPSWAGLPYNRAQLQLFSSPSTPESSPETTQKVHKLRYLKWVEDNETLLVGRATSGDDAVLFMRKKSEEVALVKKQNERIARLKKMRRVGRLGEHLLPCHVIHRIVDPRFLDLTGVTWHHMGVAWQEPLP